MVDRNEKEQSSKSNDIEVFVEYHYGRGRIGPHLPCWRGEMAGPRRRKRKDEPTGQSDALRERPRRDSDLL